MSDLQNTSNSSARQNNSQETIAHTDTEECNLFNDFFSDVFIIDKGAKTARINLTKFKTQLLYHLRKLLSEFLGDCI